MVELRLRECLATGLEVSQILVDESVQLSVELKDLLLGLLDFYLVEEDGLGEGDD